MHHEPRLRHRPFAGVHQNQNAVYHFEHALHFPAEIGVSRRVHNVDLHAVIERGGIFCKYGDAALPLQIAGVHHAVHNLLIFPVDAALLEHLVHQRRLAVVDVRYDRHISQIVSSNQNLISRFTAPPKKRRRANRTFFTLFTVSYTF